MRLAGWFCCDLGGLCLGLSCQKSTKYDHTHRYVYIYIYVCSIQYIHAKYGDNKVFKLQTIWAYDYILVNMAWHHAIKPNENVRHCKFHLPCGTYSAPHHHHHHHHLPWGLPGLGRNISTQVFFYNYCNTVYIYIYIYLYIYMHACMHPYIALHCIALHCIALHCIALHYITLHYITYIGRYIHTYLHQMLVSFG